MVGSVAEGQMDPLEEAEVDGLEPSDSSAKEEDEPREPFRRRVELELDEAEEEEAVLLLLLVVVMMLGRLKALSED